MRRKGRHERQSRRVGQRGRWRVECTRTNRRKQRKARKRIHRMRQKKTGMEKRNKDKQERERNRGVTEREEEQRREGGRRRWQPSPSSVHRGWQWGEQTGRHPKSQTLPYIRHTQRPWCALSVTTGRRKHSVGRVTDWFKNTSAAALVLVFVCLSLCLSLPCKHKFGGKKNIRGRTRSQRRPPTWLTHKRTERLVLLWVKSVKHERRSKQTTLAPAVSRRCPRCWNQTKQLSKGSQGHWNENL